MGSDGTSLKSAYELAMERMAARGTPAGKLSEAQKAALAEVDRKTKARIAELEILGARDLARAADNPEQQEKLRSGQRAAIDKVRARAEDEKERIRRQPAP